MTPEPIITNSKVKIISAIPSLDTPVCEVQTHHLGESKVLDKRVEVITISKDLPYAQRRFANSSGIKNIKYVSDYRFGQFGKAFGVEVAMNSLLARAIIVVDQKNVIRHIQIVPKILELPDLEKAIALANKLVKQ